MRDAFHAGTIPKRMPDNTETTNAKARASPSTRIPGSIGSVLTSTVASHFVPSTAITSPAMPPIIDNSTLSVSNCCAMRPRPAPSAERTDSSRWRGAARELEIGDIGARDEQHEPDGRKDNEDRRARRPDDLIFQWLELDAEALVGGRVGRLMLRGKRAEVGQRVRERHAGLDRSEGAHTSIPELEAAGVRIVSDGDVGVRRPERRLNPRPRNADNDVRLTIEDDRLPEDGRIRTEAGFPRLVGKNGDRRFRRDFVSASVNMRPCSTVAPMSRMKLAETNMPYRRSGVSRPVRFTLWPRKTPMSSNVRFWARQSM